MKIDKSWNFWNCYSRLEKTFNEKQILTIVYDLDDTVSPAEECQETIKIIKRCREILHPIFIVYTVYFNNDSLAFLIENDLPYDGVNVNPQGTTSHFLWRARENNPNLKPYADIYLDSKSFGLKESCRALTILCNKVEEAGGFKKYFDF